MKVDSYSLKVHGGRRSLQQRSLACLGDPGFFLDSLSCVVLAPSEYPHGSQTPSPWGLTPEAWALSLHSLLWAYEPLLAWGVLFGYSLWGLLSILPPQHLLRVQSSSQTLPVRRLQSVWKHFHLQNSLPHGTSPGPEILCLFFYPYLLPCLILWRLTCLFGNPQGLMPASRVCSVGVVPHADEFLMYLWRGR